MSPTVRRKRFERRRGRRSRLAERIGHALTRRRHHPPLGRTLLAAALAVVAGPLAAEVLRVAPADAAATGDRFPSLAAAFAAARPGDVVILGDGIHRGPVETSRPGEPASPIVVRAEHRRRATIAASGDVLTVRHPHWVFEGIVFDGEMGDGRIVRARDAATDLVLRDVEIAYGGNNCVDVEGERILIERASIHHCLRRHPESGRVVDAHGVTGNWIRGLTVRDSEIFLFTGDGLQFSPSRQFWDDVLVERTRIWTGALERDVGTFAAGTRVGENAFDSKTPRGGLRPRVVFRDVEAWGFEGVIGNQAAFNVKEHVDFVLDGATIHSNELAFRLRVPARIAIRNVVVHSNEFSVRHEGRLTDLRIEHVTFADARAFRYGGGGRPASFGVRNSAFVGVPAPPPEATGASNRAVPSEEFVAPLAGDYRPRAGSSLVDAGVDLPGVVADRDGASRPAGRGYDVGAYERTGRD